MKYILLLLLASLLIISGCDFTDGIIAGALHHVTLEVEFDTPLNCDLGTEDFCEYFGIETFLQSYYSEFQTGAWFYLFSVLNQ